MKKENKTCKLDEKLWELLEKMILIYQSLKVL